MVTDDMGARPDLLKVDIFAVGVMVWELWYRTPPYKNVTMHRVVSVLFLSR
jgi:hypothetical protein